MASSQGELTLGWGGSRERDPAPAPPPESVAPDEPLPDWLARLSPDDLRRVVSLARERRPLVFLVDARARWNLVRPRLPLAGFDAVDFHDQADGDFRIIAFSDTGPRELEHLMKCLRQTRPPRAAACERIRWSGPELSALARRGERAGCDAPSVVSVAEKNS